jgi:hypothetical protein
MTHEQIAELRNLVLLHGVGAVAKMANMNEVALLRLLSEVPGVRAGTEALALAYLARAKA